MNYNLGSTYDGEITIGLKDPSVKNRHSYSYYPLRRRIRRYWYALNNLSIQINEIIDGKVVFYHSNQNGYEWTCDIGQVI
mgnify:CR=1 FL=1